MAKTGKFLKEFRISDSGRLKNNLSGTDYRVSPEGVKRMEALNKYFLWDQQASEIVHNL